MEASVLLLQSVWRKGYNLSVKVFFARLKSLLPLGCGSICLTVAFSLPTLCLLILLFSFAHSLCSRLENDIQNPFDIKPIDLIEEI